MIGGFMAIIPVIVEDTKSESDPRAGTLSSGILSPGNKIKEIDAEKLRKSLSDLSGQISDVLQDIKDVGNFKLKEVQISVEISAEGGVALIGSAKAGAKGAITLTFSV